MRIVHSTSACLTILAVAATWAAAEPVDPVDQQLHTQFDELVRPFLATHCQNCHAGDGAEAALDLSAYETVTTISRDHQVWKKVLDRLSAGEMPPEGEPQPPSAERRTVVDWIRSVRRHEVERNAGRPGVVPVRRLNNAEYNYTIRDLAGVDIRPAREFPVDPANEAGFDNSADSLSMSPSLLTKYLDAAQGRRASGAQTRWV